MSGNGTGAILGAADLAKRWAVGDDWVFRFPRREVVLPGFRLEIEFLPRLAPLLPFAIPVPERIGEPSEAFPWPFFGAGIARRAKSAPGIAPMAKAASLMFVLPPMRPAMMFKPPPMQSDRHSPPISPPTEKGRASGCISIPHLSAQARNG